MKNSLSEYKSFVAAYFRSNIELVSDLFEQPEAQIVAAEAIIPDNWELDSVLEDEEEIEENLEAIQEQYGSFINSYKRIALLNDKYSSQIVYTVLESDDGKLYMGEYVGD